MTEELKLIIDAIGDLSGMGAWLFGAYLAYNLLSVVVMFLGFGWMLKLVVSKVYAVVMNPKTRIVKFDLFGIVCGDEAKTHLVQLLKRVRQYHRPDSTMADVFDGEVDWMDKVLTEAMVKQGEEQNED